jgi:two-component system chemotaxis response regulator CheB
MPQKKNTALTNIVVIGGSQGAVEALLLLVPRFPADLSAALFIVVHMPVEANSYLPNLLRRAGRLPVCHPGPHEIIRPGNVYVAPPNFHMTVDGRTVCTNKGPRENRHRPAIDPLFRSAARTYGPAVIAVVLSGNLDDGSAGLLAVRKRGGIGIVQDPDEARASEMPQRALDYAGADYVLPLEKIADKIIELTRQSREVTMKKTNGRSKNKASEIRENEHVSDPSEGNGKPSVFACPECHGVLWELKDGKMVRYRCRVGHGYTEATLKGELDESTERALWAAMRALEEKAAMSRRLMVSATGSKSYIERLKDQALADVENAHVIRKMIFNED